MRAYAILDGGGVKGAALVGCLQAAEECGVEFVGYGGTSAGSIVALLSAAGMTPVQLKDTLVDKDFGEFIDDDGTCLRRLRELPGKLKGKLISKLMTFYKHRDLWDRLRRDLGFYAATKLQEFLRAELKRALPALELNQDVRFNDLKELGCRPLKVVASDLRTRSPCVFSARGGKELNGSVIDAVRASTSYPFVFQPVRVNDRYLVDGGLSSNLPIFLFEDERREDGLPVIAFDLVASRQPANADYGLESFIGDLLETALESGDWVQRLIVHGVYHVRVAIPANIDTLDFSLAKAQREELFNCGYVATSQFFHKVVPQWGQAKGLVERLQALHAPAELVQPILRTVAKEFEAGTPATHVRAHVMLPTDRGTRIVVYQYGMDNDPDSNLELIMDGGCSGTAWRTREPTLADLTEAKTTFPKWKMTREQQNKVRTDRQAMFSVPMFDLSLPGAQKVEELNLLGILSVDSDTPLDDTKWIDERKEYAVQTAKLWADILSRLLL